MSALIVCLMCLGGTESSMISIDASHMEPTPFPHAFLGQFGEHLGSSIYGGKWAQILRNPGFEGYQYFEQDIEAADWAFGLPDIAIGRDQGLACYWQPDGEATYALDTTNPFNSELSQRIELKTKGGLRAPVMLPLHRTREYDLSFYLRCSTPMTATVEIRDRAGAPLAQAAIAVNGDAWTRFAVKLNVAQGPGAGDLCYLAISFDGTGTVWLDLAELFPTDHVEGFDPTALELMKELHVSLLRFPGGNFASTYHWRDGIGPREKRPMRLNQAWGIPEPNHVGADEWIAFTRLIGAQPLICINCGDGSPEEAADWVRYCNEPADGPIGSLRAANGHPEPYGVRLWEIGNELWGDWQTGYCTPETYASRYDAFARAMKEADPSIDLIANGGPGDWDGRLLMAAREPIRSLSMHRLIGYGVPDDANPDDVAMALAAYGIELERQLIFFRHMASSLGHPDLKIALTEVMSVTQKKGHPSSHSTQMEVPFFAGVINACVRQRDCVELITRTATINHGGGRAKVFETVFPEPIHFLSKLYGEMSGHWVLPCTVNTPVYNSAVKGFPPLEDIPVLDAIALFSENQDELTLFVTNRDARNPQSATLHINGFTPTGNAHIRTLGAFSAAFNTWQDKQPRVRIIESDITLTEPTTYAFPPCSVTAMVFKKGA